MDKKVNQIINSDCLSGLKQIPDGSVNCCVTSPPYFGLRNYGVEGQIGLEPTPEIFISNLVEIFQEVKRVLRDDGTLWLNLGDSHSHGGCGSRDTERWPKQSRNDHMPIHQKKNTGCKPKDLLMIPARVAIALQADGWYLRSDIIWHKKNAMPESVTDRPTHCYEHIFLLAKSEHYYYDADSIKEKRTSNEDARTFRGGAYTKGETIDNSEGGKRKVVGNIRIDKQKGHGRRHDGFNDRWDKSEDDQTPILRNKRDVWTVATKPCKEDHFATFPPELIRPCILAGCPEGGIVLDPFMGAGTTALVALQERRNYLGFELNPEYIKIANKRLKTVEVKLF